MIWHEVAIEGTLRVDGTLELDGKPDLPPGRVAVILRREPTVAPPAEDLMQFVRRSRRELASAGSPFLDDAAVEAHIDRLREADPTDAALHRAGPP